MKKFILMAIMLAVLCMFSLPAFAGSLFYADNPSTLTQATGATLNTGTALVTGQCNVQSITISGANSTALDYILIYDAASATGTAKLDISVGTAGETIVIPLNDAEFGTGVFADASSSNLHITLEYTQ